MSASNYNWVCFDCRYTTRKPKTFEKTPACIICGKDCCCLGYKVPVPKKDEKKEWRKLKEDCQNRYFEKLTMDTENRTKRKHEIEKEIKRLVELNTK